MLHDTNKATRELRELSPATRDLIKKQLTRYNARIMVSSSSASASMARIMRSRCSGTAGGSTTRGLYGSAAASHRAASVPA